VTRSVALSSDDSDNDTGNSNTNPHQSTGSDDWSADNLATRSDEEDSLTMLINLLNARGHDSSGADALHARGNSLDDFLRDSRDVVPTPTIGLRDTTAEERELNADDFLMSLLNSREVTPVRALKARSFWSHFMKNVMSFLKRDSPDSMTGVHSDLNAREFDVDQGSLSRRGLFSFFKHVMDFVGLPFGGSSSQSGSQTNINISNSGSSSSSSGGNNGNSGNA
jgi:hypothetical protein